MPEETWKVGELAARTGLTVRTLHHYDAIGLLSPSGRTGTLHGSGHRLYTVADLARLHQILCLKQLGFGLEQVKEYLTGVGYDPRQVVRLHHEEVLRKSAKLAELGERLRGLSEMLERAGAVSPETFLSIIEAMIMFEKHYTPAQMQQIDARGKELGQERIREVEAEWPRLMAEVQAEMAAGTTPTDPKSQALARRWFGLVAEFTGGDPSIFKSLKTMYRSEDNIAGMDVQAMRPMMDYIEKAAAAAGIQHPSEE
jgi:DNA-binding transcriptional MerR regulator